MGITCSTTRLLAVWNHASASWHAVLDECGDATRTQPEAASSWSLTDLVAQRHGLAMLNHKPDVPPPWPSEWQAEDDIHAWMDDAYRDRPGADVRSERNAP